jgi:hypothetical protein
MRVHHNTLKKAAKFHITLTVEDNEIVATAKDGTRLASGLQGNKVLEDAITRQTGHAAKGNGLQVVDKLPVSKSKTAKPTKAPKVKKVKVSVREKACRDAGWVRTRGGFKQEGDEEVTNEAGSWDELYVELVEAGDIDASDVTGFKHKYKEKYRATHGRCGDELGEQITEHVKVDTEDGSKTGLNELRRFAEANGCWVPAYASLRTKTGEWNAGSARASVANRLRAKIRQAAKAGEKFTVKWA